MFWNVNADSRKKDIPGDTRIPVPVRRVSLSHQEGSSQELDSYSDTLRRTLLRWENSNRERRDANASEVPPNTLGDAEGPGKDSMGQEMQQT
jgi:hypothetical protein